jgi:hypothetical protein
MKTKIEKVYHCEFCKKHSLSGSATSRHEKYCRSNPHNKHRCFAMCVHLIKERKYIGFSHVETIFTCAITKEKMYSYLAEKKQTSYFTHPNMTKGLIRMPLECDLYKEMSFEEQTERFDL